MAARASETVEDRQDGHASTGIRRTVRSKKELQREQTYQALIETAESLFAEQGIAAVSLRQIADQAGSLNTSVVSYYFGSKEALLEAIYRNRLPQIERWRAKYLKDIDRQGRGVDLGELLTAIWLPWYEQRDKAGRHSYGRYLLSVDREGLSWMRLALDPDYPASFELHNRVKRVLEQKKVSRPDFRFTMQINMILETLCYIDRNALADGDARAVFLNALAMAQAALVSPCESSDKVA